MAVRKKIPLIPTDSALTIGAGKTLSTAVNLDVSGADVAVVGSGTAVITFPSVTGTLAKLTDITGTNSGTNTGDNTNFAAPLGADDNYVTDAEKVVIGNTSGTNSGNNAANTSIAATKLDDFTTPDNNTDLNANTTNHGLLLLATAPAAGLTNVVAIENGETVYKNKALFSTTHPSDLGTAAEGSGVTAARIDHVHNAQTSVSGNAGTATAAASQVITDNAIVTVDVADAADNDYAKFTAAGVEGRSYAEVLSDIGAQASLGFTAENIANKDTDGTLAANSDTKYSSQKATKTYIDNLALGLVPKPSAHAATTTTLPTNTYSNGASGVGATLTAITVGVLTVDGIALALNDYVLVKNEVLGYTNGLYVVTTAGAVGVAYILTRDVTMNQTAEFSNSLIVVENGTSNAGTIWLDSNNGSITVGTTVVTFTQIPTAGAPIAGTGISVSGATVSIDTGVTVDKTTAQTLTNKTLTSPVINTPTGIAKGDVGLGNVDNTSNATERAAIATLTNKTLTSPKINEAVALTATATELNLLDGVTATTTELNYIDGVTSAIQTQIDGKQASGTYLTTVDISANTNLAVTAPVVLTGDTLSIPASTASVNGYATSTQITKLDGITAAATANAKISGATLDTLTDDTGFVTAKAVQDGHNVPHAVPGTSGNILQSNGTDWASVTAPTLPVKATGAEINTSTDDAKFVTAKAIHDSFIGEQGGWINLGACTYEGADDPTYTFSFASDMTAILSAGMKIKLTDSTVCYFIITAVGAYSGGKTIITGYGGTDYNLTGGAITLPYYSTQKAPFGFPLSPAKWTVEVIDTTNRTQTSPTQNTWYNLGSVSISIPIGCWNVSYQVWAEIAKVAAAEIQVTLSTANNSDSDADFRAYMYSFSTDAGTMVTRLKTLLTASKTPYYLNTRTLTATVTAIYNNANGMSNSIIRAVCAYI